VELLSRLPLKYGDERAMLAVDLEAVSCAARMARSSGMPVHASIEVFQRKTVHPWLLFAAISRFKIRSI